METNNITAAPQIRDTNSFFEIWSRSHYGNMADFYLFMTVPSVERDEFMESLSGNITSGFDGPVFISTLTA